MDIRRAAHQHDARHHIHQPLPGPVHGAAAAAGTRGAGGARWQLGPGTKQKIFLDQSRHRNHRVAQRCRLAVPHQLAHAMGRQAPQRRRAVSHLQRRLWRIELPARIYLACALQHGDLARQAHLHRHADGRGLHCRRNASGMRAVAARRPGLAYRRQGSRHQDHRAVEG